MAKIHNLSSRKFVKYSLPSQKQSFPHKIKLYFAPPKLLVLVIVRPNSGYAEVRNELQRHIFQRNYIHLSFEPGFNVTKLNHVLPKSKKAKSYLIISSRYLLNGTKCILKSPLRSLSLQTRCTHISRWVCVYANMDIII